MTPLQSIKMLIKAGVTADGDLGADRMKVWKAKDFAHIHWGHKPTGVVHGVEFKVIPPKSKSKSKFQGWVEIRWRHGLSEDLKDLLDTEFSVCIGWKRFTGVRGEQLTALIDAVLYSTTAEVVKVNK